MQNIKLMEMQGIFRQKKEQLLNPDKVFLIYTGLSWILKFIINVYPLPNLLEKNQRVEITFFASVFLTLVFIIYSYFRKIDWYGKEKNAFVSSVKKWTLKRRWTKIFFLPFLFFLDPFLFFIYFKNGSSMFAWQILAWFLLALSLFTNCFAVMILGNIFKP